MPPRRATRAGFVSSSARGTGARWRVALDIHMQLDAVPLLDHVTDVMMAQHLESIVSGQRADGGGSQKPLVRGGQQGRLAAEGIRPDARGFTGRSIRPFGPNIVRKEIRVLQKPVTFQRSVERLGIRFREKIEGTKAKTSIQPDPIHLGWLVTEGDRGVEYFYVDGLISRLIDMALAQWLGVALDGALKVGDKRERKASKAKHAPTRIFGVV